MPDDGAGAGDFEAGARERRGHEANSTSHGLRVAM